MLCVILQLYLSCILLYRTSTDLCLVVSCEQIFTLQHHMSRYHTSRYLSSSI